MVNILSSTTITMCSRRVRLLLRYVRFRFVADPSLVKSHFRHLRVTPPVQAMLGGCQVIVCIKCARLIISFWGAQELPNRNKNGTDNGQHEVAILRAHRPASQLGHYGSFVHPSRSPSYKLRSFFVFAQRSRWIVHLA